MHLLSVITLKHYLPVLGCSSAGTVRLHLLGESAHICVFVVYTLDYSHRSAEFSCFQANLNALLLLADLSADADVFW